MTNLDSQYQDRQKIAERLKTALEEAKIKGVDVARLTGTTPTAVSRWLSGKRDIRPELLQKLYETYSINPFYIITGEGPPVLRGDEGITFTRLVGTDKKKLLGKREHSGNAIASL